SRIPLPAPAPASTSTVWPRSTSARTPAGVSATRCSPGLISLGAPTITRLSYRTTRARRRRIDVCALRERRGVASLSSMSIVAAGQKYSLSGRITSIRQAVQSIVSVGNGVLGGYLAAVAFGWTVGIATGLLVVLVVVTFFMLTERPQASRRHEVLRDAGQQIRTLVRSRPLWAAGVFLALVYIS